MSSRTTGEGGAVPFYLRHSRYLNRMSTASFLHLENYVSEIPTFLFMDYSDTAATDISPLNSVGHSFSGRAGLCPHISEQD